MDTRGGAASRPEAERDTAVGAEFVYRLTAEDFEQALRGRARRSAAGRVQALLPPVLLPVAVGVVGYLSDDSLMVWSVAVVLAAGWGALISLRSMRTMARRMASLTEPYGECRTVADETGSVSTGERGSFSSEWAMHRAYLETPGLFVLLTGDRAAGIAVVPKRGARGPADVDRLREILDGNLKRL
ncbi:hypothetical protein [Streptomyces sp. NPDC008125]|uniref:hypothetical protein n=1 Tax=Streptomyces sp. NPDC008125 TaxID=3364811 RepID=UPI0036E81A03